jgi:energy-coupling factor transporter transmembrane protein EcfT
MRAAWHEVWGCAKGPVARLAPHVRIAGGAGVFATCMVAPTSVLAGGMLASASAVLWLCACWPPARLVRTTVVLGLAMLLPYAVLIALFSPRRSGVGTGETLAVLAGLLVRGMSALVASFSTIATLSASDLREGLARLPVPTAVSAILLQIVHQTAVLAYETKQVASAMSLRVASRGRLTLWRVLASLPQVWLPRIVQRADRVAAAMELRGFCAGTLERREVVRVRLADWVTMSLVAGALALALVIRWSVR